MWRWCCCCLRLEESAERSHDRGKLMMRAKRGPLPELCLVFINGIDLTALKWSFFSAASSPTRTNCLDHTTSRYYIDVTIVIDNGCWCWCWCWSLRSVLLLLRGRRRRPSSVYCTNRFILKQRFEWSSICCFFVEISNFGVDSTLGIGILGLESL